MTQDPSTGLIVSSLEVWRGERRRRFGMGGTHGQRRLPWLATHQADRLNGAGTVAVAVAVEVEL